MKLDKRKRMHINGINSVLTGKVNYKYRYESKIDNSDINNHSTEPPELTLAKMVLAPHTISLQLKRLEKRYQSEYLRRDLKAIKFTISVVED
jgi:hypothetical protein